MFKLKEIVFVVIFVCAPVKSDDDLCANSKINKTCMCYSDTFGEENHKAYSIVDCSGIALTSLPNQNQYPKTAEILDLSFNKIQTLDQKTYPFSTNFLQVVHLQYNEISYVDDEFFSETPNLIELDLSFNNISDLTEDVFLNLERLEVLKLRYNKLTTLPDGLFSKMTALKVLDVSLNFLGGFLVAPEFRNGFIVKLGLNTQLLQLYCEGIGLKDNNNLLFSEFTNLTTLVVSDNLLNHVPKMAQSVEYLDVSGNNISLLNRDYLYYRSLKVLKLDRLKRLTFIEEDTFYDLVALEELSISECRKLKEFNEDVFGNLSATELRHLKKLDLSGNNLKTLDSTFEKMFDGIEFLDFSNNPWVCDCHILWMKKYYDSDPKHENIVCAAPIDLAGKNLNEITEEEMPECFPEKFGKRSHKVLIPVLIALVVVLIIIIILLIKYAPSYKKFQETGPDSPYNLTSLNKNEED